MQCLQRFYLCDGQGAKVVPFCDILFAPWEDKCLPKRGHVIKEGICFKTAKQQMCTCKSVQELLAWIGIEDLDLILKERRLHWYMYGHVEHSNSVVKTAFDIYVDGKHGPGRPKMT